MSLKNKDRAMVQAFMEANTQGNRNFELFLGIIKLTESGYEGNYFNDHFCK